FKVRKQKEETDARESVMTFVLGLVGDALPHEYLNNPPPDRAAEIKGRQVLDKYNCAGCHQLRPGLYEFKLSPEAKKSLAAQAQEIAEGQRARDDYDYHEHLAWMGGPQPNGEVTVRGARARPSVVRKAPVVSLVLTEAMRFPGPDGKIRQIRANETVAFPSRDFLSGPQSLIPSPEAFRAW